MKYLSPLALPAAVCRKEVPACPTSDRAAEGVMGSGVVAEDGCAGTIPKSALRQNYQTQQGNGNEED